MANVIVCDGGCGAESPDPGTGLHEANHWLRVRAAINVEFERVFERDDKMFCKNCCVRVREVLGLKR